MRFRLRTLPLLLATGLLLGVAYELYRLCEVIQLGHHQRLPPTMYGEHAGIAVALACAAAICVLASVEREVTPKTSN